MKLIIGCIWVAAFLILWNVVDWRESSEELDVQRTHYVDIANERILRIWGPKPQEGGLVFMIPAQGRMVQGQATRQIEVKWFGKNDTKIEVSAEFPGSPEGVRLTYPKNLHLIANQSQTFSLGVQILKNLPQNIDTIDVHLAGEVLNESI